MPAWAGSIARSWEAAVRGDAPDVGRGAVALEATREAGDQGGFQENLSSAQEGAPLEPQKRETMDPKSLQEKLTPLYLGVALHQVGIALVYPQIPYAVLNMGGKVADVSRVVSIGNLFQAFGSVSMGFISDRYGRKAPTIAICAATALCYLMLGAANSLDTLLAARIFGGLCGGIVPVAQAIISDVAPSSERPKYLGRMSACIGLGFVLGPLTAVVLQKAAGLSLQRIFTLSAVLPFMALIIFATRFSGEVGGSQQVGGGVATAQATPAPAPEPAAGDAPGGVRGLFRLPKLGVPELVLLLNSVLSVFAFSGCVDGVYALFLKDRFGLGSAALSTCYACNGLIVGSIQFFLTRHFVRILGAHKLLSLVNLTAAAGLLSVATAPVPALHFVSFTLFVASFSIGDVALASLISQYADKDRVGRTLGIKVALDSTARVLSPRLTGAMFQTNPALPFLAFSILPVFASTLPISLRLWEKRRERAQASGAALAA